MYEAQRRVYRRRAGLRVAGVRLLPLVPGRRPIGQWRASVELPRNKPHAFASLDLQPSWREYVDLLGYGFAQWDVHAPDLDSLLQGTEGVVCLLSNIMCYCTDEATADLFYDLLTKRARPSSRTNAAPSRHPPEA